ncbi:MAG: hypothetical protein HOQ05_13615 [Corynebacteriales bacterium]|nr:hypothetical protein [Mycobacteriales bacterium]
MALQIQGAHGRLTPNMEEIFAQGASSSALHMDSFSQPPPLPLHLQPIVQALASGATDEAASARLGLSPRTFSRRVAELLRLLEVESRFQAGLAASRRGWI